jgi:hypothetical protein
MQSCFWEFGGLGKPTIWVLNNEYTKEFFFPKYENNLLEEYSFYYVKKLSNKNSKFIQKKLGFLFNIQLLIKNIFSTSIFRCKVTKNCVNINMLYHIFLNARSFKTFFVASTISSRFSIILTSKNFFWFWRKGSGW